MSISSFLAGTLADGSKAGRKIRISGRLWMNSLDALATAAKEGAGIVRVPSWQAEADLAASNLVRLLAGYEPARAPLHLTFQPARLASPKIRAFGNDLVERCAKPVPLNTPTRTEQQ